MVFINLSQRDIDTLVNNRHSKNGTSANKLNIVHIDNGFQLISSTHCCNSSYVKVHQELSGGLFNICLEHFY